MRNENLSCKPYFHPLLQYCCLGFSYNKACNKGQGTPPRLRSSIMMGQQNENRTVVADSVRAQSCATVPLRDKKLKREKKSAGSPQLP